MSGQILVGHVIDELRALPADSVHCAVTSPPYFGLRAYGSEPQVWGGSEEEGHTHEWGEEARVVRSGGTNSKTLGVRANGVDAATDEGRIRSVTRSFVESSTGAFCPCGAWRGELGAEPTPELYVQHMVEAFREVRRVLRPDGTLWLNLGDSYGSQGGAGRGDGGSLIARTDGRPPAPAGNAPIRDRQQRAVPPGLKPKDLIGIPWLVAFALQADGWYLRSDIIWSKPNPMPESVTDRPTKSHEYLFLLTKSSLYFYDVEAIREPVNLGYLAARWGKTIERARPDSMGGLGSSASGQTGKSAQMGVNPAGRNRRSVWEIATQPYAAAHFATYPEKLVEPCILAGTSEAGCCAECGTPRQRVVEREGQQPGRERNRGGRSDGFTLPAQWENGQNPTTTTTTGWRCTCRHDAPAVPCTVLDPFLGSGTTGAVCNRLGRDWIGIEINEAYAALARRRTAQQGFSFAAGGGEVRLLLGDCLDVLPTLADHSVDAVVTDPPYDLTNRTPDMMSCEQCSRVLGGSDGTLNLCPRCGGVLSRQRSRQGRGFMGKDWDGTGVAFRADLWREVLRVLKPGGHALVFGGTRTHHRLMVALEDAGFEIRDCLMWLYASGFPKSMDVSKAMDKAAGAERPRERPVSHQAGNRNGTLALGGGWQDEPWETSAATDLARQWEGWGTALKPAYEPIVLARAPLSERTVAANVARWGTGALNIDGSRIGVGDQVRWSTPRGGVYNGQTDDPAAVKTAAGVGRWPANLVLSHTLECIPRGTARVKATTQSGTRYTALGQMNDDAWQARDTDRPRAVNADADGLEAVEVFDCHESCPVAELDRQSGERTVGGSSESGGYAAHGGGWSKRSPVGYGDTGGASRFFFVAKASRSEREDWLSGTLFDAAPLTPENVNDGRDTPIDNPYQRGDTLRRNLHPTVKPIALMRHLVKLITPPGGVVLDPFLGSGSTGLAAQAEGFDFVGIEREPEYLEIARRRIAFGIEEESE